MALENGVPRCAHTARTAPAASRQASRTGPSLPLVGPCGARVRSSVSTALAVLAPPVRLTQGATLPPPCPQPHDGDLCDLGTCLLPNRPTPTLIMSNGQMGTTPVPTDPGGIRTSARLRSPPPSQLVCRNTHLSVHLAMKGLVQLILPPLQRPDPDRFPTAMPHNSQDQAQNEQREETKICRKPPRPSPPKQKGQSR